MVLWSTWLNAVATALEISATEAGIVISLVFTIISVIMVLVATKGKQAGISMPIISLFDTIIFTFIGWFPLWTGSIIALSLVALFAWKVAGSLGG